MNPAEMAFRGSCRGISAGARPHQSSCHTRYPQYGPFLTVFCVVSLALVDFDHILDLLKVLHCIAERKLGTGLGKFLGA